MKTETTMRQAKQGWKRWRAICDQIISHPGYRYNDPRKFLLLKLARFACVQMAHHNNIYWRLYNKENKS